MKTKLSLLFMCLCMTLSQSIFAGTEKKLSPASGGISIFLSLDIPNDGPQQDGKEPITPNQFTAILNNRTLTITTTLEDVVSLQLQNLTTNEEYFNVRFNRSVSYSIVKNGSYLLTLNVNNTTLRGLFDIELSQDEAANIVLKMFENEAVEIYVSNSIYNKGDTIHVAYEQVGNEYIIANNQVWVAFVDLYPDANWGHECNYLLIDIYSGKITEYKHNMPLKTQSTFKQYKFFDSMNGLRVLNQQDAFAIVDSIYQNNTVSIYMSNDFYYGGETIELPNKDVVRVPYPLSMYWIAFVDLYPMESWGHKCEYVFINAYTRQVTTIAKNIFPKDLQDLFTLERWDNKQDKDGLVVPTDLIVSSNEKTKMRRIVNDTIASSSASTEVEYHKWAIIISGGYNIDNNWVRYWNDCSAVYKSLINNGYVPEQIFVAISDGLDDAADMRYNNGFYANSPWDLDGDGINDVQFSATRGSIEELFNVVRNTISGGDELFIFTTDHGGKIGNNSVLWLWNEEFMYDFEFANLVESLNAGIVNIVMEKCYSGGFIDDFQSSSFEQVVISTACNAEQPSWARYDAIYDEFIYWWCTAVNGITPDGTTLGSADYNNDGYISMQEAYIYACAHDVRDESPQQYSNDYCLKFSLTLTDLLSLCDSPVMVNGYDLYIKDNAADLGDEPNTTTDKSWISTDIWFEEVNGGVTNTLQQGNTYRVCARVYNRGDQPSPGGEIIYWHWTKAMIGGSWPYSWFDEYEYSCDGTPIVRGAIMNPNGTTLPSINGGESYVVYDYWTVPVIDYTVCSVFENNLNELWHYCLLARIVDAQDQPGEDGSEQPFAPFVLNHNNVASRNFSIISDLNTSSEGLPSVIVGIAAPNMHSDIYHLYCDLLNTNIEWGGDLRLYLTLSPNMYSNWSMTGSGYADIEGQGRLEINANHAELLNIFLDGNEFYPIKVELENTSNYPYNVTFDIYLVDNNGDIIGGQRFIYSGDGVNDIEISPSIQDTEQQSSTSNSVIISCTPNPAETTISIGASESISLINIYNTHGQRVISTNETSIDVSNLSKGIYLITVETENGNAQTKFVKQ